MGQPIPPASSPASLPQLRDRFTILSEIHQRPYDLAVIGGGIHGALFARLAAAQGLRTVLLERGDYASGTSSRSSKMAHGGLRYLEMFDFEQVHEALEAREDLYKVAPHLVYPHQFFIPTSPYDLWGRTKLSCGLTLYDLFAKAPRERRFRWSSPTEVSATLPFQPFSNGRLGAFVFFDGIMNDASLVLENIFAARLDGADCLNYVQVTGIEQSVGGAGSTALALEDTLSHQQFKTTANVVVNCAGPWVGAPFQSSLRIKGPDLLFSRGSHLLFDIPWKLPALLLPLAEKGRYYFVWPHPAGTMVGTTERETTELSVDPIPSKDEVEEILLRLEKDLPGSGLTREKLHYAFAGLRVLPLRPGKRKRSGQVSRRHIWEISGSVLSLFGGKFTSALWTVEDGWRKLVKRGLVGSKRADSILRGRMLPGAVSFNEAVSNFRQRASSAGLSAALTEQVIQRQGAFVQHLVPKKGNLFSPLSNLALREEIELAITHFQAMTIEDLLRRRLGLEYAAHHGLPIIDEIVEQLSISSPDRDHQADALAYRNRMTTLHNLCEP